MRALGAFVMTTVLFTAAMVIAHGLAIPDPERRFLPTTERNDSGDAPSEETGDDLALDADSDLGTPQSLDEPSIPEVTAVPTPDDATGNSLRDDERERGAAGKLATNDDASDDAASGDAGGDHGRARDTGTDAADRGTTPDDPADERPPSGTPSTSTPTPTPTPQPRSSPSPSPSPTASEPSEVLQPTQSSSLIVPSTDDRDHDDRYMDTWNPYWWEQDRDRHWDDGDRYRDGDRRDDDDRHRRRR
jgi:hypothetical protein